MKLSTLFKSAYSSLNKAECALQTIWNNLIFEGFEPEDLPNISSGTSGSEIFLEYRGKELHEEEIINLMESNGCITPDNFEVYQ